MTDRRTSHEAMRPQFSSELRSAIRERIRRYPAPNEGFPDHEKEVRRWNALPIGFDMDAVFFLTEDGDIFEWDPPPDAPSPVTTLWVQLVLLRRAASDFPELIEALPRRPGDAVDCAACGGRGFVDTRSPEGGGSKDWPCWPCGTMGWHLGDPLCR